MHEYPIGKRYDGGTFKVEAGMGQAYAAATDDPNPRYVDGRGWAPPMFHVRPCIGLMMLCATDAELKIDIMRLVHGEHHMTFDGLLREGDEVALEGELLEVAQKSSGMLYRFALRGRVEGRLALDGTTTYFVRGRSKGPKKERAAPPERPVPTWSTQQDVSSDQADRYAAASGDHNPIHLDESVAKMSGLPGVILHGLCTLAFAQRDLVDRLCPEDPSRLVELGVRFASPAFPGDQLTLNVWEEEGTHQFETLSPSGKPVLTGGRAVVR